MAELHCVRAEIDRKNFTDKIATSKHPRGSPILSTPETREENSFKRTSKS